MADDRATLEIVVEAEKAKATVNDFAARYIASIREMFAATQAGVSTSSAEFVALKAKVLEDGTALLQVGQQGVEAMTAVAAATGKIPPELAELQGQLVSVTAQLREVRAESAGTGKSFTAGAVGVELLGNNVEKLGSKVKSFTGGLLAGFVLGPVIGAVNALIGIMESAVKKLYDFFIVQRRAALEADLALRLVGESAAKYSDRVRTVGESVQDLADYQLHLEDSTKKNVEATRQHSAAVEEINALYHKELAAATSVGGAQAAREKQLHALTSAENEYHDAISGRLELLNADIAAGKKLAEQQNKDADAVRAASDAIEGNAQAIDDRSKVLQKALPALVSHGRLTRETFENAKTVIRGALDEYAKFGIDVPEWLQKVSHQLGILTTSQEKLRREISGDSAAMRDHTEDLKVAYEAARNFGEINQHSFENAKAAVESALDEYEHFGKAVPADLASVAAALGAMTTEQQKLKDSIVGNSAAMVEQTKNLELVIAATEKDGKVTPAIQENIKAKIQELLKTYQEFGQKVPESLDAIARKYDALAQSQKSLADVFAGGDAQKKKQSLQDEKKSIEETVQALEKKQKAGTLELQEENALWEAKDKLANTSRDLTNVTHDLDEATSGAADSMGNLRDDVANTVDGMGPLSEKSRSAADALDSIGEKGDPAAKALKEVGDEAAKITKDMASGSSAFEAVIARLNESHLPATLDLMKKINAEIGQAGSAGG